MSKCAQHALHMRSMGENFGNVLKPLMRSDASAALGIAYRRGLAGKTRHVLVDPAGGGKRACKNTEGAG